MTSHTPECASNGLSVCTCAPTATSDGTMRERAVRHLYDADFDAPPAIVDSHADFAESEVTRTLDRLLEVESCDWKQQIRRGIAAGGVYLPGHGMTVHAGSSSVGWLMDQAGGVELVLSTTVALSPTIEELDAFLASIIDPGD